MEPAQVVISRTLRGSLARDRKARPWYCSGTPQIDRLGSGEVSGMSGVPTACKRVHRGARAALSPAAIMGVAGQTPVAQAHPVISARACQQQYSLSCEFASPSNVRSLRGAPIREDHAFADTSWSDNPHSEFRGNNTGVWSSTWESGIYAEPLAEMARSHGSGADVSHGAGSDILTSSLDQGIAVFVRTSVLCEAG